MRPRAGPRGSRFLQPGAWQRSAQARGAKWDMRKALEAAGLTFPPPLSLPVRHRFTFDDSPPPAPSLVRVF